MNFVIKMEQTQPRPDPLRMHPNAVRCDIFHEGRGRYSLIFQAIELTDFGHTSGGGFESVRFEKKHGTRKNQNQMRAFIQEALDQVQAKSGPYWDAVQTLKTQYF